MQVNYYKEYSYRLGRDMEFKTYGTTGKILIAFPPQDGHFYDFENFQMTDLCAPWVDAGKIMLVCPDAIDEESWSDKYGDEHYRLEQQERWFAYINEEFLPSVRAKNGSPEAYERAMTTGCSMGAVHAANFFFRRPDLYDTVIALSGCYNAQMFFPGCNDPLVYDNSPAIFLRNMPLDHPYMELYRNSRIIICIGQGRWEDELLESTRELDAVMREKGIPAWVDYWGFDCDHDWPWWRKQLPYFLEHVLGSPY
ncbi:MAG: esterase family protein [Lachnospiraceae bacterium]|nr:esterase family protein [Lachnospiraceae bacterium]